MSPSSLSSRPATGTSEDSLGYRDRSTGRTGPQGNQTQAQQPFAEVSGGAPAGVRRFDHQAAPSGSSSALRVEYEPEEDWDSEALPAGPGYVPTVKPMFTTLHGMTKNQRRRHYNDLLVKHRQKEEMESRQTSQPRQISCNPGTSSGAGGAFRQQACDMKPVHSENRDAGWNVDGNKEGKSYYGSSQGRHRPF